MTTEIIKGDCVEVMAGMEPNAVDLVFGSPPYEDARTYGIDFNLKGQEWVDWMVEVVIASQRVCKGLVAFVVEGKTTDYKYSATPILLMADLHRRGVNLRNPPIFHRVGIAGSGGPDWVRNDYEFIVCCTPPGRLSWSDNTAMGHPPKYGPGGEMSNRSRDGARVNQWGCHVGNNSGPRNADGSRGSFHKPSHVIGTPSETQRKNGEKGNPGYNKPILANPGNVISRNVGGGHMGSKLAHKNEAPFPESLAEFFVRSFCPEGGTVLDPFGGSGTVAAVCEKFGRNAISIDIRQSQCDLTARRVEEARLTLFK